MGRASPSVSGTVDEAIVPLFQHQPYFSEAYTKYQVLHSAAHGYKPANCQKLKAAGMCPADCGAKNPASIALAVSERRLSYFLSPPSRFLFTM